MTNKNVSDNSLRICIIAPFNVLSSAEGASVRVLKIAQGLNDFGASVFVLHYGPERIYSPNFVFIRIRTFNPFTSANNYVHPFNFFFPNLLKKVLKKYSINLVQCEQPWSTLPAMLYIKQFEIPCVLDEHNVEFLWSAKASKIPFLAPLNYVIEKIALYCSSIVLVTSEIDKKVLKKIYKFNAKDMFVVPNGVDTERFSKFSAQSSLLKANLQLNPSGKIVVFHGLLSAKQNYEAAKLIVTFIAPNFPNDTFLIMGKNPPKWLKNIAENQKNVRLLGFVQNIEDYLSVADLCIVPIRRGSGTRLKIMDYLAAGKPIVSTYIGAEGIPIKSGIHAILCDEVNLDFIDSMKLIFSDRQLSEQLSFASRDLAETMSWQKVARSLNDAYLRFRQDQ